MTDLINHLTLERPSALILVPLGVDPSKVALVLAETVLFQGECYVVTWDSLTTSNKNVKIISYSNVKDLDDAKNNLIIFDNFAYLSSFVSVGSSEGLSSITRLLSASNKIIVLSTYGIRESDLKSFSKASPGSRLWKATFADRGQDLQNKTHETLMSQVQDLDYWGEEEMPDCKNNCPLPVLDKTEKQRKICNVFFSNNMKEKIESKDANKDQIRKQILDTSPKIKDIVTNILMNKEKRHVIYTANDDYYGLAILEFILSQNKLNIFIITSKTKLEDQVEIIKTCNKDLNSPMVLITTNSFPLTSSPMMIDDLHILDNHHNRNRLINQLYKYRNYPLKSSPPSLVIHHYVTHRANGDSSIDTEEYMASYQQTEITLKYWKALMNSITDIVVSGNQLILI